MSYSSTVPQFRSDRDGIRRGITPLAVGVLAASTALTFYGAHQIREAVVVTAIIAATVVGVYGFLLPRKLSHDSAGGTALTLSVLAALLIMPAFWSGLPLVLGVAGLVVGNAGRKAPSGAGKCIAAVVMGTLAAVGYLAIYVSDGMNNGAGFLFS
jgi:hypothetical protein